MFVSLFSYTLARTGRMRLPCGFFLGMHLHFFFFSLPLSSGVNSIWHVHDVDLDDTFLPELDGFTVMVVT
uniref:Uncharacterized protein n=1 Tax=Cryphonectria parasitica TaxID=5116 RepID=P87091_CRYPA|nr:unknown [Cryphonectria parasitica]